MESAAAAKDELAGSGIDVKGFASIADALADLRPAIVAVCSPYVVHREQLRLIAEAGCHCLCEKPLWWGPGVESASETATLVDSFLKAGLLLDLLTQWPQTLASYFELFPLEATQQVDRFEMRLSPVGMGPDMVLDAMPHVLSMLWALLKSPREIARPKAVFSDGGRALTMEFAYRYGSGTTQVTAQFVTCVEQPRPAWYAINGYRAERKIDMSEGYAMQLVAGPEDGGRSVCLPDPLPMQVRQFVEELRGRKIVSGGDRQVARRERLISSVVHLATLYATAREAAAIVETS